MKKIVLSLFVLGFFACKKKNQPAPFVPADFTGVRFDELYYFLSESKYKNASLKFGNVTDNNNLGFLQGQYAVRALSCRNAFTNVETALKPNNDVISLQNGSGFLKVDLSQKTLPEAFYLCKINLQSSQGALTILDNIDLLIKKKQGFEFKTVFTQYLLDDDFIGIEVDMNTNCDATCQSNLLFGIIKRNTHTFGKFNIQDLQPLSKIIQSDWANLPETAFVYNNTNKTMLFSNQITSRKRLGRDCNFAEKETDILKLQPYSYAGTSQQNGKVIAMSFAYKAQNLDLPALSCFRSLQALDISGNTQVTLYPSIQKLAGTLQELAICEKDDVNQIHAQTYLPNTKIIKRTCN